MRAALNRVAFTAADGLGRLSVMCARCAYEVHHKLTNDGVRVVTRPFGGSGTCELCCAELRQDVVEGR